MNFELVKPFTLASRSPRRLQLLREIGVDPDVITNSYGEELENAASPAELATINAKIKFSAAQPHCLLWMLSADTVVGIDGVILGKPTSNDDAKRMLNLLSGRCHEVTTSYCIGKNTDPKPHIQQQVVTEVAFKSLSEADIDAYVATGSPLDKAGAYGLQDLSREFVEQVQGSVSNVIGLPVDEVAADLVRLGVIRQV